MAVAGLFAIVTASASEPSPTPSDAALAIDPLLKPVQQSSRWGVEIGVRYSKTSFVGDDSTITDNIPMFYYEGERFFVRGLEGGAHLWRNDCLELDVLGRYRFFDFPEEYDGWLERNVFDAGIRASWQTGRNSKLSAEILSDKSGRIHGTMRLESEIHQGRWLLHPLIELRAKSSDFNTRYYGFGKDSLSAGIDARAALRSRVHVRKNLHFHGSIEARLLDGAARRSSYVDGSMEYMAYIGFGFYEPLRKISMKPTSRALEAKPYLRLSYGWGNDSTLAQILSGDIRKANVTVDMVSLFYGHPLSDTLFGLPVQVYLRTGIAHHYPSGVQDSATEYVLGVKFYYTFPTPWRIRIGLAEGISYMDSFTYYETTSLARKGRTPNKLLNYLDLSIDVNLGDVFKTKTLDDLSLGYGIHHRSGIGGTSPTFGKVAGGSNYDSVYLQWSTRF